MKSGAGFSEKSKNLSTDVTHEIGNQRQAPLKIVKYVLTTTNEVFKASISCLIMRVK